MVEHAYLEMPTLARDGSPVCEKLLKEVNHSALSLDQHVHVDAQIPGCPPVEDWVKKALEEVLDESDGVDKKVYAEAKSLCDNCSRKEDLAEGFEITELKRIIIGLEQPVPEADVNADGNVDALDITTIELIIMGG